MTTSIKAKKIALALEKNVDLAVALGWAAYDAELVSYDSRTSAKIAEGLVSAWDGADSDIVGDVLSQLEGDAPKAVQAIWDALLS